MPVFSYPLAFLALTGIPILATVYFLQRRHKNKVVSSLFLWEGIAKAKQGGSKFEQLRIPLVFLLELLVIALLALAAVDPRYKIETRNRPLAVILDCSVSMQALDIDKSCRDKAIPEIKKEIRKIAPSATRFFYCGKSVNSSQFKTNNKEIDEALETWQCNSSSADISKAISLAYEICGQDTRILVVSDHLPEKIEGNRIKYLAFGKSQGNIGFINAARSPNNSKEDKCLLEVYNASPAKKELKITVLADNNFLQQITAEIKPQSTMSYIVKVPAVSKVVEARLEDDAFLPDNAVKLYSAITPKIKVANNITNVHLKAKIEKVLNASNILSNANVKPQFIFTDQLVTPQPGSWYLLIHLIDKDMAKAYIGPFVVDYHQAITEGLSFDGVVWSAQPDKTYEGQMVISAGNTPLLTLEEARTSGIYHLYINTELSTLPQTANWPIMFWNILNARARELNGINAGNLRLGTPVQVNTSGVDTVKLLQNEEMTAAFPTQGTVLLAPPAIGTYTVEAGLSRYEIACNLLNKEESNLNHSQTGIKGKWLDDQALQHEYAGSARILALLVMILIAVHTIILKKQQVM